MKKELDKIDDKYYGADFVHISKDIMKRYNLHRKNYQNIERFRIEEFKYNTEIEMMKEFCRDNIKVYRQLSNITSEYKINYLEQKLIEMRTSIKILNKIDIK